MDLTQMKEKFKEVFNYEATQSFFAPGRINLIGEHIDYNGGMVFPAAITLGTYAVVAPRKDKEIHAYSMNFEALGKVSFNLEDTTYDKADEWVNYVKGTAQFLQEEKGSFPYGLDIVVYGNIPNGSGLSSSASLEMLITFIFKKMYNIEMSGVDAALLGKKVENLYMGVNSGIMDQFAVAMGQKDQAILLDCSTLKYEYFPISLEGYKILIMNTNKRRELADSKYNERRAECESALAKLKDFYSIEALCELSLEQLQAHKDALTDIEYKRAYHAVGENTRVIEATKELENRNLERFGELLNASHISLRDDYAVTGIELDTLVETAWKNKNVLGARMTGAGFGGCAFAIVKEDCVEELTEEVGKAYIEKVGYAPSFYIANISNGPIQLEEE